MEKEFDWQKTHPMNWPDVRHLGTPKMPNLFGLHIIGPFKDGRKQVYRWVPHNNRNPGHWLAIGSSGKIPPDEMVEYYYVGPFDIEDYKAE